MTRSKSPNELQFVSVIGYLQTQCQNEFGKNCSVIDQQVMLDECAEEIRTKGRMNGADYDRHQFLR